MAWGKGNIGSTSSSEMVTSVNGKTGEIILTAEDIDAAPKTLYGIEELIENETSLGAGVIYCMYEE